MPNKKILVIEDDFDSKILIEECLRMERFDVISSLNPKEALAKFPLEIDLIIMDLSVPAMSPADFLKTVREEYNLVSLPVLIVSGKADIAEQATFLNAQAYLKKPFDLDLFLNKVAALTL